MKDLKMCSFRLNSEIFDNFKDFCTRNNITMRQTLTKFVNLVLEADRIEQNMKIMFPNQTTGTNG